MSEAMRKLEERQEVHDATVRLFMATDRRDWAAVADVLADNVHFDMTSLAGGAPQRLAGSAIADAWRQGLAQIDHVHHQLGNFIIRVGDGEADVECYGIAFHHRRINDPANTRTFVGSYRLHLVRLAGGWRIDGFRFDLAFVSGNLQLESAM